MYSFEFSAMRFVRLFVRSFFFFSRCTGFPILGLYAASLIKLFVWALRACVTLYLSFFFSSDVCMCACVCYVFDDETQVFQFSSLLDIGSRTIQNQFDLRSCGRRTYMKFLRKLQLFEFYLKHTDSELSRNIQFFLTRSGFCANAFQVIFSSMIQIKVRKNQI